MEKEFIKSIMKNKKQYIISSHEGYIKLYEKIYSYYKVKQNDINLLHEKKRLKLLKENDNINFLSLGLGAITMIISITIIIVDDNEMYIRIFLYIALLFLVGWFAFKYLKLAMKDIDQKAIYGVAINVIDDIEKELKDKKKLDEIQVEDRNPNYEVLKEIAITTSTGILTNIIGSGVIRKLLKKK
ncbi:hypothetical protein [Clostridium intestinale]|uniref:hypothetical protein n=1 Tax=Clostridium intestinale TaxID=36845 RepID=UPI0028ED3A86|nr:hypothetical protein [Clostridium intestinale]